MGGDTLGPPLATPLATAVFIKETPANQFTQQTFAETKTVRNADRKMCNNHRQRKICCFICAKEIITSVISTPNNKGINKISRMKPMTHQSSIITATAAPPPPLRHRRSTTTKDVARNVRMQNVREEGVCIKKRASVA